MYRIIGLSLECYPVNYIQDHLLKEKRKTLLANTIDELEKQLRQIEAKMGDYNTSPIMKDAKVLSVKGKSLILKSWHTFLKSGFEPSRFTQKIYNHLHRHCGFLAQHDKNGFYYSYWNDELNKHSLKHRYEVVPAPVAFFEWESFMKNFRIWGDYIDINVAMMIVLHYELLKLSENLIAEVKEVYRQEMLYARNRMIIEQECLQTDIHCMNEDLQDKKDELNNISPESYLQELKSDYQDLFGYEIFSLLEGPEASQQFSIAG